MGPSSFLVIGINIFKKANTKKLVKSVLSTFNYIKKNGIDNNLIDKYKKSKLLEMYTKNNKFSSIANRLGEAELIYGDYKKYNREIDLLEQLTNEDIKRIITKYFHQDNIYTLSVESNLHLKKWYTPITIFFADNFIFRFWNPFIEMN